MKKFEGIYPALITPFDKEGNIDINAIGKLVKYNVKLGVNGFYIGGSTGESYLLWMEERKLILEAVMDAVPNGLDVIVNVGTFSTEQGCHLARHAQKVGASAISSVPPFYFNFSLAEYIGYYNELAAEVEIPTIIYNVPAMSGVKFSKDDIGKLFENEKIAGVKHTSYDLFQMQRIIADNPDKSVFIGHDEIFLSAWSAGATAAIGSTFNFMADKFVAIAGLYRQNRMSEALALQSQANAVIEVLCRIGVFKGVKAALKMKGIDCGYCRRPFMPLEKEQEQQLEAVLLENDCL